MKKTLGVSTVNDAVHLEHLNQIWPRFPRRRREALGPHAGELHVEVDGLGKDLR